MRTRLISLVILLVVAGSAVAGAPLHSNEQSCSMGGAMGEMDCCKAALSRSNTPIAFGASNRRSGYSASSIVPAA